MSGIDATGRPCCIVVIFRFTGRGGADEGVAGSDLLSGAGELTQVGSVFVNTYKNLQKCEELASTFTAGSDSSDAEAFAQIAGEYCCRKC